MVVFEKWFPSPYGVIFILTMFRIRSIRKDLCECFRLLTELYSFLRLWKIC